MPSVEERLTRLEHDRAIRDLKMRYLRAADGKDCEAMRDCFVEDAHIAFEGFPEFAERDAFIDVYRQLGCAPGIYDIHQGGPGIISFTGPNTAEGWWPLQFHNINLAQRSLTQLGVEYHDSYVLRDGRWWIAASRSLRKSCLIQIVDDDGCPRTVAMGEGPEEFGDTSRESS